MAVPDSSTVWLSIEGHEHVYLHPLSTSWEEGVL